VPIGGRFCNSTLHCQRERLNSLALSGNFQGMWWKRAIGERTLLQFSSILQGGVASFLSAIVFSGIAWQFTGARWEKAISERPLRPLAGVLQEHIALLERAIAFSGIAWQSYGRVVEEGG
jgi:hypothetical protein